MAYKDLGFAHPPKFLTVPHIKNNLWIPDTFFPVSITYRNNSLDPNERSSGPLQTEKAAHRHLIDTENMFLRIHPDGRVSSTPQKDI